MTISEIFAASRRAAGRSSCGAKINYSTDF